MATKATVPAIRFAGFTTPWELRKFDNLYIRAREKNDLSYGNDKIISVANMYFKTNNYITDDEYLKTYNVFKLGDIAFEGNKSKHFAHGRFVENTIGDGIVSHVFDVFRPKTTYDLLFWKHLINNESIMSDLLVRCTKSSTMMTNLVADDFLKESLLVPKVEEQRLIGKYLSQLDELIALQRRKLVKLQNVKKAMLQKMFPTRGSTTPQIRFAGFTEPWQEQKLGDVGQAYAGLSGKSKADFGHGSGKYVTYMNVLSNAIANPQLVESIEVDAKQNEIKSGDVLFTISSETPEEVGMSSVWLENRPNTYLNSFCFGYRPIEKFDSFYLGYMLRSPSVRSDIAFLAQGISRFNISKNKVMEIAVPIPADYKEQQAIGNYFSTLDTRISLQQRKLEKLQNVKKACLAAMFV